MGLYNPHEHRSLASQILRQQKHAWDLERDIPWSQGVDLSRHLLPLDNDSLVFPSASVEQRLALSQLVGLIVNSTIAEMETVIHRLRDTAWASILRSYSVNPEMWELGELFFEEENKHAVVFSRYIDVFCRAAGIDREDMNRILPQAFGSTFLFATQANAKAGGHAFWWVVASVEEVSIALYQQIQKDKDRIDPLYHAVHKRHMEEESRHHNYAFLMLELIANRPGTLNRFFHKKVDLAYAQIFSTSWLLSETSKVFRAKKLAHKHPFFAVIASCAPLIESLSPLELARKIFVTSPYLSLFLNLKNHRKTFQMAEGQHAFHFPHPDPLFPETFVEKDVHE